MALAGEGGDQNRGEAKGEEANSKAVVAAKTGNLAVSLPYATGTTGLKKNI